MKCGNSTTSSCFRTLPFLCVCCTVIQTNTIHRVATNQFGTCKLRVIIILGRCHEGRCPKFLFLKSTENSCCIELLLSFLFRMRPMRLSKMYFRPSLPKSYAPWARQILWGSASLYCLAMDSDIDGECLESIMKMMIFSNGNEVQALNRIMRILYHRLLNIFGSQMLVCPKLRHSCYNLPCVNFLQEGPRSIYNYYKLILALLFFCMHTVPYKTPHHFMQLFLIGVRGRENDNTQDRGWGIKLFNIIQMNITPLTWILYIVFRWCGPCKVLAPRLEKLINNHSMPVNLVKVDVDKLEDLAMKYRVSEHKLFKRLYVLKDVPKF